MELGALVCTSGKPDCVSCPLRRRCSAYRQGRTSDFPARTPRPRQTIRHFVAFAVRSRNFYLVRQRPCGVVNAGLWEFPNIEVHDGDFDAGALAQKCLGFKPRQIEELSLVRHTITRYSIVLHVFRATLLRHPPARHFSWRGLTDLEQLVFPSAHRKIVRMLALEQGNCTD